MSSNPVLVEVSCAVEVFLATALLHREQPERKDFTIQEIVNRAARENITGEMRSGVNVHASQHCVANKAPNPAKHRMLFATGKHTRRLVLPEDEVHPERTGRFSLRPLNSPSGIFRCWSGPRRGTSQAGSQPTRGTAFRLAVVRFSRMRRGRLDAGLSLSSSLKGWDGNTGRTLTQTSL